MTTWSADEQLDPSFLDRLLDEGGRWDLGAVASVRQERIGVDYGLSGRIHRLHLTTEDGRRTTLVAKSEHAAHITRAVAFRGANEARFEDHIPTMYGAFVDHDAERGVILLEDISPARQGDDLTGCTKAEARSLVAVVARLHTTTWLTEDAGSSRPLTSWARRDVDAHQWKDRLKRAISMHPDQLEQVRFSLGSLPRLAAEAHDALVHDKRVWVHHDPHLDNVLWREDGRISLLDWSNSDVATPAIDVAVLLNTISFRPSPSLDPDEVLECYHAELSAPISDLTTLATVRRVLLLLARGMISWMGSENDPDAPARARALRESSAFRVRAAFEWIDR